jgi:uncharacterized protein YcbX
MHLAEIWRYPVKSMGGEALPEAVLGPLGIQGDRELYVVDEPGDIVTSREKPRLLLHRAAIGVSGEPTVDGLLWTDIKVAQCVAAAAGESARLVRAQAGERFDILPLLVATDGAVAALGEDRRRLRPNLLIGGVAGLDERKWEGRSLCIGNVVIGLVSLRKRCVMTTWNPDTIEQDPKILRRIYREFDGSMALDSWVMESGRIAVGDKVELIENISPRPPTVRGRFLAPATDA